MNDKFYIFSSQRAGSFYLMQLLDDHPQIFCAGSIFKKTRSNRIKGAHYSFNYSKKKKTKMYRWFPRRVIKKHLKFFYGSTESDVKGFRMMVNHSESIPTLVGQLNQAAAKPIILIRKNIVRQAISLTIAQSAGVWISEDGTAEQNSKLNLDIDVFKKNLRYMQRCRSTLENTSFSTEPLMIYYDDLANNHTEVVRKIYTYLGVLPEYETSIKPMKQSNYKLSDRLSNYKDIARVVQENGLGSFIQDECDDQ